MPSTYKTGFCNDGQCEGTKPRSYSGIAMKTCPRVILNATLARDAKGKVIGRTDMVCTCQCHADMDRLFEMSGMERVIQENPEYHVPKRDYWMPSLEDRVASSMARHADTIRHVESPAPDVVPATIERVFAPTSSGRAGRGELELYVKQVCDIWAVEKDVPVCSPAYISEQVAKRQGWAKPPSQGAIDSVLKRWVGLGFAVVEKKPTRFVRYTEEGVKLGLDAMKVRARLTRR